MKKKSIILVIIMTFILSSLNIQQQTAYAAKLTDIPPQYAEEINFLIDNKIVVGRPDKTFGPRDTVTREAAVTMIGRALGLDETKRSSRFPDVNKNSYGSGYIASAVEAGIITGYTDGTFRPKAHMTRGGMAYLLKRAFELKGNNETAFHDITTANKSLYEAVDALASNGLTNGTTSGKNERTYEPNKPLTRAEFALFVARGLEEAFRVEVNFAPLYKRYVSAKNGLNIRSGPSNTSKVIGWLKLDTEVDVYSKHGNWVYMKAGSQTGYVHSNYLVKTKPKPTPKPPVETNRRYIAIDAGHGGTDSGAIGNKLVEKEINLAVAKKLEKSLKKQGIDVFMIRTSDKTIKLDERVAMAEKAKVNALVSIHTNSYTSGDAHGTETYYNNKFRSVRIDDSERLATFIQNRLYKAIDTRNRGVKTANFAVLRTSFPSALVELAFISNKDDAKKLGSEKYQQKAADAIAAGIVDYYDWKDRH